MTDRPHPDLDAPLSVEEAEEMRRVTKIEKATRLVAQATPDDLVDEIAFLLARDAEIRRLRAAQAAALAWARHRGYLEPDYADEDYPCDELWTAMIDALRALAAGDAQDAGR